MAMSGERWRIRANVDAGSSTSNGTAASSMAMRRAVLSGMSSIAFPTTAPLPLLLLELFHPVFLVGEGGRSERQRARHAHVRQRHHDPAICVRWADVAQDTA